MCPSDPSAIEEVPCKLYIYVKTPLKYSLIIINSIYCIFLLHKTSDFLTLFNLIYFIFFAQDAFPVYLFVYIFLLIVKGHLLNILN